MTIKQVLEQIQEYVKELKNLKVENEELKKQVSELEEQANLNLAKAQEIVEELKVMINAE